MRFTTRKLATVTAAVGLATTLGGFASATSAQASATATGGAAAKAASSTASGTAHGCPSGAVCIYPGPSWSGTPQMFWSYGYHNLSGQYGTKRIFNNQYDGATMRTCTGWNGTGCEGYLPPGWYIDKYMTPINSIVLVRP